MFSATRILKQLGSVSTLNNACVPGIYSGSTLDEITSSHGERYGHFFDRHGNRHMHTEAANHAKHTKPLSHNEDAAVQPKQEFRAWGK